MRYVIDYLSLLSSTGGLYKMGSFLVYRMMWIRLHLVIHSLVQIIRPIYVTLVHVKTSEFGFLI